MRKLIVVCLLLAVVLSGAAQAAKDEVIKIGVYEPMTGSMAAGGQMVWEGIQLALEMKPTVLGKKVELVLVDNKSDKVESANAVARLVKQEKVAAIVGSYGSSNSIAGGDVAENAGIPMVTDSATNPLVTMGKKYIFRACFIDPFQGEVMAKYTYQHLKKSKAAILKDVAQDYSVGLAAFYKKTFTGLGGKVVSELAYQTGDQDFTAQLTQIIASGAEVIFIPGYFGDAALIARQAREMGSKAILLGGDALDAPELVEIGGKATEGLTISSFYSAEAPGNALAERFVAAYKAKYSKVPNANAALGFDTLMLILDAIERANSAEPKAIRDQLAQTKGFVGVTGALTMDADGNAVKDAVLLKVVDGVFRYEATVKAE